MDSDGDGVGDVSKAEVVASYAYYPFGAPMPGRVYNPSESRHGFNGYEKDDELAGQGKMYTTTWRPYDSQLGRWWATDPRKAKYPAYNPYSFTLNSLNILQDPAGDTVRVTTTNNMVGFTQIRLYTGSEIANGLAVGQKLKSWVPVYEVGPCERSQTGN